MKSLLFIPVFIFMVEKKMTPSKVEGKIFFFFFDAKLYDRPWFVITKRNAAIDARKSRHGRLVAILIQDVPT